MLCREIIPISSEIHIKHINTVCGQNVEFVNVKLAVRRVTTVLYSGKERKRNKKDNTSWNKRKTKDSKKIKIRNQSTKTSTEVGRKERAKHKCRRG
jgi:hypothetical protein